MNPLTGNRRKDIRKNPSYYAARVLAYMANIDDNREVSDVRNVHAITA